MKPAALLLCMLMSASVGAATADDYAWAWPLQTTGDSAAWQIEMTPEIYAALRSEDLRDLAVINAADDAVPVAQYRTVSTSTTPGGDFGLPGFFVNAPVDGSTDSLDLHIQRDAQGKLRSLDLDLDVANTPGSMHDLLLDASTLDAAIDSLWLDWNTDADINAQLRVSGSDDLQQWRVLVASATLMQLRQDGNLLARHQIALHGARASYLRLHRLDNGPEIDGLHVRVHTQARSTLVQSARVWVDAAAAPPPRTGPYPPRSYYYR